MIISIVGGGATGITILRHLAELAASERDNGAITGIQLFDKSGFDGGVAYRTQSDRHLLNMKPSTMSIRPGDGEEFLRWIRARGLTCHGNKQLPRMVYRDYLDAVRLAAIAQCRSAGVPVHFEHAEIVRMRFSPTGAVITTLKHRIAIDTLARESAATLDANQIGHVHLSLDRPLVFEAYRDDRDMGSFILLDPISHRTAAAGMIDLSLRRATNIHWQRLAVDKSVRARLKQQRPCVLWFTGLSGAGKSTIADLVDRRLAELGRHAALLDGDNLRHGINRDLGFSNAERAENVRRVAEIAALFVDTGMIALVALISPFRSERELARQRVEAGEFIEIHVATPLAECERRDPKGLYRKARAGELKGFTGIDDPYEAPQAPEITVDTSELSTDAACERIIRYLREHDYL